jgi:hypothetical protein
VDNRKSVRLIVMSEQDVVLILAVRNGLHRKAKELMPRRKFALKFSVQALSSGSIREAPSPTFQ